MLHSPEYGSTISQKLPHHSSRPAGRGDAFFALFLPVFLTVLVIGAFFRFPLAFALALLLIAITSLLGPLNTRP
jgi:hypothetical protein